MIKLGLAGLKWSKAPRIVGPVAGTEPAAPTPDVLQSIAETAAWCSQASAQRQQLRSHELDPSEVLILPPYDHPHWKTYFANTQMSYQKAVDTIIKTRRSLLAAANIAISTADGLPTTGRLLLYEPWETVNCGASEESSRGFFNIEDAPPWDTWFLFSGTTIFCYVPDSLTNQAQAGIDDNPVDCIRWAPWPRLSVL